MANLPISGLTASATNLASTDLAPVVQTVGVGPVKMTGLQLAGGLLGSATFNGATVTTSQPVLNLTQTWNAGAVTFTGLLFNAAGSSDANSASGSLLLDLQVGGASKCSVRKDGNISCNGVSFWNIANISGPTCINTVIGTTYAFAVKAAGVAVRSAGYFGWTNGVYSDDPVDLFLYRDASNTLALKNAGNAQIFRVYSTTASSGSYGIMSAGVQPDGSTAQSDTLYIGSAGAGAAMTKLALVVNGTTRLNLTAATAAFTADITATGYVKADGANGFWAGASSYIFWNGRTQLSAPASNVLLIEAASGDLITKLGGSTSSFPALKRSATGVPLQVRLADDSGDAALQCGTQTAGGTAFNVNGTGGNSIASVTNTTTGTLLQVLNSTSNPLMTVTDTTAGTLFSVQSTTAATLFSVNDTTSGTLLAVTNSSATDVFTVADNAYVTINSGTAATQIRQTGGSATYPNLEFRNGAGNFYGDISVPNIYMIVAGSTTQGCAINSAGFQQRSDAAVSWGSSTTYASQDIYLARDATGPALALRNSTNAQTFRIYGSYTSSTVYDRLSLSSSSTAVTIAAETDTGDMDVVLTPAGTGNVKFGTHSAIGAETVTGYITIKDSAGNTRKLAVVS